MINAFKQIRLNGVLFSGLNGDLVLADGGALARQSALEASGELLSDRIDFANSRIDSNFDAILAAMSGITENSDSISILEDNLSSVQSSLLEVSGNNEFFNQYFSGDLDVLRTGLNIQATGLSSAFDRIEVVEDQINFIKSNLDSAALDSLTEIVNAFQNADGSLSGALSTLTTGLNQALADEIARATAAEALLNDIVEYHENRISGLESQMADAYSAISITQSEVEEQAIAISELQDGLNFSTETLSGQIDILHSRADFTDLWISGLVDDIALTGTKLEGTITDLFGGLSGNFDLLDSSVSAATGDLVAQIATTNASLASLEAANSELVSGTAAGFASLSESLVSGISGIYEKILVEAESSAQSDLNITNNLVALSGKLDSVISNTDAAALDSLTEIVAAFQSADSDLNGMISALGSNSSSNVGVISGKLDDEIARATAAESQISGDLAAEVARAAAAETQLFGDLSAEVIRATAAESQLSGDLAAEVARATTADSQLSGDLAAEIARATAADSQLSGDLAAEVARATTADSQLSGDLAAEVARAQIVEQQLDIRLGQAESNLVNISGDLAAEIFRAQLAEDQIAVDLIGISGDFESRISNNSVNIESLFGSITGLEDSLQTTNNTIAFVAQGMADAVSGISETIDLISTSVSDNYLSLSGISGRLDSIISNTNAAALDSLSEIVSAFQSADSDLSGMISALGSNSSSNVGVISGKLDDEIARATAAESQISGDLAAEVARAAAAESQLSGDLAAEVARATAAESQLSGDLAAEVARATTAESQISGDLAAEVARAAAAETQLFGDLSAEVIRAIGAEENITNNLNNEIVRANAYDSMLSGRIDAAEFSISSLVDVFSGYQESTNNSLEFITTGFIDLLQVSESGIYDSINTGFSVLSDITSGLAEEITSLSGSFSDVTSVLSDDITALSGRLDSVISNTDVAALDSLTEIVAAFQSVDSDLSGMISALGSNSSSNVGVISGKLDDEISRATAAESQISGDLAAEVIRATTAESNLDIRVSTLEASKQAFTVGVPVGNDSLSVSFPGGNFSSLPSIAISLQGEVIYQFLIKNKTVSGFDIEFSDTILESNTFIDVMALI